MPGPEMSVKDILDRSDANAEITGRRLDAMEARSSAERAAIRAENRYLTGLMILVIAALAGVQVHYSGLSLTGGGPAVVVTQSTPAAAPAPAPVVAPALVPAAVPPTVAPTPEPAPETQPEATPSNGIGPLP